MIGGRDRVVSERDTPKKLIRPALSLFLSVYRDVPSEGVLMSISVPLFCQAEIPAEVEVVPLVYVSRARPPFFCIMSAKPSPFMSAMEEPSRVSFQGLSE